MRPVARAVPPVARASAAVRPLVRRVRMLAMRRGIGRLQLGRTLYRAHWRPIERAPGRRATGVRGYRAPCDRSGVLLVAPRVRPVAPGYLCALRNGHTLRLVARRLLPVARAALAVRVLATPATVSTPRATGHTKRPTQPAPWRAHGGDFLVAAPVDGFSGPRAARASWGGGGRQATGRRAISRVATGRLRGQHVVCRVFGWRTLARTSGCLLNILQPAVWVPTAWQPGVQLPTVGQPSVRPPNVWPCECSAAERSACRPFGWRLVARRPVLVRPVAVRPVPKVYAMFGWSALALLSLASSLLLFYPLAPAGSRTCDLRLSSPTSYPLGHACCF